MSNSNQSAGQVWKSKEDQLEAEWRQSIVSGIGELREGQANLDERFSEMAIANQTQHGALGGELRELTARFERALEESNKKLESRSKVIRGLVVVIFFLLGLMAEAKTHLVEFLKALAG